MSNKRDDRSSWDTDKIARLNAEGKGWSGTPTKPDVKKTDPHQEQKPDDVSAGRVVSEVGAAQRVAYGNPLFDIGKCYDFWGDLIEGEADKTTGFVEAYRKVMEQRKISGVKPIRQSLHTQGFFAQSRNFEVIQRGIVTGAVYVATLGSDLYVSWRVFVLAPVSQIKVGIWLAICAILAFPTSLEVGLRGTSFNFGSFVGSLIVMVVFTGLVMVAYGFARHGGDFFALWREPLNEFQLDDVVAVGLVMHKSVLAAADEVGIDSTKLAARELLPQNRQRRI